MTDLQQSMPKFGKISEKRAELRATATSEREQWIKRQEIIANTCLLELYSQIDKNGIDGVEENTIHTLKSL